VLPQEKIELLDIGKVCVRRERAVATWLPTYLRVERGLSWLGVGLGAAAPLLVGALANIAGGYWTDLLVRRLGLPWGRRIPAATGLLAAAVLLALATGARSTAANLAALALSFGAADLILLTAGLYALSGVLWLAIDPRDDRYLTS